MATYLIQSCWHRSLTLLCPLISCLQGPFLTAKSIFYWENVCSVREFHLHWRCHRHHVNFIQSLFTQCHTCDLGHQDAIFDVKHCMYGPSALDMYLKQYHCRNHLMQNQSCQTNSFGNFSACCINAPCGSGIASSLLPIVQNKYSKGSQYWDSEIVWSPFLGVERDRCILQYSENLSLVLLPARDSAGAAW